MKELPSYATHPSSAPVRRSSTWTAARRYAALALLAVIGLQTFCSTANESVLDRVHEAAQELRWKTTVLSKDPQERALQLMARQPVIDGHVDLEILSRYYYANDLDAFDLRKETRGQVDFPRMRKGKMGGFFHSVFVACPEDEGYPSENQSNFTTPTWRVRDTLEQIDTARLLIDKYGDQFELTLTAQEWRKAMRRGKFGGMLGVEGGHQLGSSLSTIRTYFDLGVRYITLTHTCHSALADSCGYVERPGAHDLTTAGTPLAPRWNGLSPFGRTAIREMNRLGMMVDLSHTSPKTASDALSHSLAPVIFSHSNARGVHSHSRNIPDTILRRIGSIDASRKGGFNLSEDGEKGQGWGADTGEVDKPIPAGDAIIMLNFSPTFVSEWSDGSGPRANVTLLADHADYIGRLAGREHLGIGSDFDGIEAVPEGLEDVSKYPNLIAELIRRGWTDKEIMGLTSGNLLRIVEKVEAVARKHRSDKPSYEVFSGRTDLVKHD
ncbi:hypothetical protein JCM10908_000704 [Rhodotorula pacifica]|uniref:dipeptidase n=1 Tax=Rhodotorula pacifica TaxID=1495444 RepID=UPI0031790273